MLLIQRKIGETVLMGDGIEVTVMEISGSRVKLGVQAPPEVQIVRKEIHLAALQNVAAAKGVSAGAANMLAEKLRAVR
jgi:carbon storage regulator